MAIQLLRQEARKVLKQSAKPFGITSKPSSCNSVFSTNFIARHLHSSATGNTAGKVITCNAAVLRGPNQPLIMDQIHVDPPQPTEARIKIIYTSICHTDLTAWKGENEAQRAFPRILGHEAVGVVESVGEGVHDVKEGDYVIPIFNGECGHCVYCSGDSKSNLCEKYRVNPFKSVMYSDGKCRFHSSNGDPIFHFLNTSTFTEYSVIDSACLVKVNANSDSTTLKKMSLLSCAVSTGVGAAWNAADVKAGSTVAVFGLGSVGLAAAEGARVRGASKIIGVDVNSHKFVKGKAMGITDFINPKESPKPVHEKIREMTGGGVTYSFECVGNPQVLREAFLSSHDGWGKTVLVGIYPGPETLPIHPMELFDGRSIIGTIFGDFKGKTQLPHLASDCIHGVVNVDELITHELPFEKINEAFQLLQDGKALRCLLHV